MSHLQKKVRSLSLALVCVLALGSIAVFAQRQLRTGRTGRPLIKVALHGTVEREGERIPFDKASAVKPGELLDWTITAENQGDGAAHQYKAVGQIPRGTQIVAGSTNADGSATVTYSIDNGKSFSQQPLVEERQADGSTKQVPAPASMYTQIRYEWAEPLVQGGKLNASYKLRVK